jgi:hypothetical protein
LFASAESAASSATQMAEAQRKDKQDSLTRQAEMYGRSCLLPFRFECVAGLTFALFVPACRRQKQQQKTEKELQDLAEERRQRGEVFGLLMRLGERELSGTASGPVPAPQHQPQPQPQRQPQPQPQSQPAAAAKQLITDKYDSVSQFLAAPGVGAPKYAQQINAAEVELWQFPLLSQDHWLKLDVPLGPALRIMSEAGKFAPDRPQ